MNAIKETLSANGDFQHVSTAAYISDLVHELYLLEWYPHTAELGNYAGFKTMTAELSHYLDVRTCPTRQCCIQNSRTGF